MGYGLCSINAAVNFQIPVYKIQPIIQLKFINKLIYEGKRSLSY